MTTNEQPTVQRTAMYRIPDHQLLLSFNSDDEAIEFTDWLQVIGWMIYRHHTATAK